MKEEFKPYIPADKVTPEFTVTSIITGVLLAIVFGAANAYLGLKVGMTISASIPAAVISMAVIRIIMRRDSILESNMVQTIGSAGESLAAGAIFTLPALFIWHTEGVMDAPSMILITVLVRKSFLQVKREDLRPRQYSQVSAQVFLLSSSSTAYRQYSPHSSSRSMPLRPSSRQRFIPRSLR